MDELFQLPYGVIPACDVNTLEEFRELIKATCGIRGIVGYKVGCILALRYGLAALARVCREHTNLPLVYDHQKAGTDTPHLGEGFAKVCKEAGVVGVIIFPQSGPETGLAFVQAVREQGLTPILGGEMTHPRYLASNGGFLRNEAPTEMYTLGAEAGVEHFVVPGNKPDMVASYKKLLQDEIDQPIFLMPGIGSQGGQITSAFKASLGCPSYAIVGRAIYKAPNMTEAAEALCAEALEFQKEAKQ